MQAAVILYLQIAIKMRQWLKRSRDRLNNERRFQRGPSSVISKSLGDLPMNGSGVGMFFRSFIRIEFGTLLSQRAPINLQAFYAFFFSTLKKHKAIDGPSGISKMRSHRSDDIKYLAVDDMNRRRYWRTGDTREDIWRRISRPKLSLFVLANNNKLGI